MDIIKLKKLISPIGTNKYLLAVKYPLNLSAEDLHKYFDDLYKDLEPGFSINVIYIGDFRLFPKYKDVVAKFKKKAYGGVPIYRNYCINEKEQRKRMGGCNVAQDAKTSFNTVISALGSPHGIILTIETNDTRSSEIIQAW